MTFVCVGMSGVSVFACVRGCVFLCLFIPNLCREYVRMCKWTWDDMNFPFLHPVLITGKEDVDKTQPGKDLNRRSLCALVHETWGLPKPYVISCCIHQSNSGTAKNVRSKRTGLVCQLNKSDVISL